MRERERAPTTYEAEFNVVLFTPPPKSNPGRNASYTLQCFIQFITKLHPQSRTIPL